MPGTGPRTGSRGFDGSKGHVAVNPDSEIITATTVTPGNTGDAVAGRGTHLRPPPRRARRARRKHDEKHDEARRAATRTSRLRRSRVYGDAAYGTGEFHERLGEAGIGSRCKTQAPTAPGGMFSKDRFAIDLGGRTRELSEWGHHSDPSGPLRRRERHRLLRPGYLRRVSAAGAVHHRQGRPHDPPSARTNRRWPMPERRQADTTWVADYRATRPKVERKLGGLMRRRHGGRRTRGPRHRPCRGRLPLLSRRGQPRPAGHPPGCTEPPPAGQWRSERRQRRRRHARTRRPITGAGEQHG